MKLIEEVIVPADDLVCIGKDKLQKVIRCKDCRYYGERMANGYWTCSRPEGCVKTLPEGFCGWAIRRKENGTKEGPQQGQKEGIGGE